MDMALAFEPCLFPRISTNRRDVQREAVDTHDFGVPSIATKESMLQYLKTAWAILLAKYTNSCAVRFGLLSDQSEGLEHDTVEEWTGSLKHKHCAQDAVLMRRCNKWLSGSPDYKGRFNTAIAYVDAVQKKRLIANWAKQVDQPIDLMVLLESSHLGYRVSLYSRPTLLDQNFVRLLASTLTHVLHHITGAQEGPLESLDLTPDRHRDQIRNWSESSPKEAVDECIHHLIQRRCVEQPNSQAICAWDGTLTYNELDHFSSIIGSILEDNSIGSGSVVPLFFEKSKWTAVAILGVLKTGAAFVLLEPSHPVDRLRHICQDVKATIILSSTMYAEASSNLNENIVEISERLFTSQIEYTARAGKKGTTRGSSKQAAYIAYTSGSTGLPKGIIIEHGSFCTNVVASSEAHNLNGSSRVLQFASYAFDVSIHETLVPLILGACICVPSASQRVHELQDAINDLRANWMELTPSVARLLDPDDIPAVETLILGGEAIMSPDVARWASRVKLIVAYGPAECTVVSTLQPLPFPDCDASNIGRAYGGTAHVVEADNHEQLVPIGVAGELVIGGPIVGREYLNRPELTAAAFITKKSLPKTDSSAQRFYKTGDLVRQTSDGTFIYIGRKDTQVKIRGQRIELGEIEHHAQDLFLGASVAAGVAKQYGQPILVLFVAWAPPKDAGLDEDEPNALFWKPDNAFTLQAYEAKSKLTSLMPIYMVPNFIIPLRTMPLSHTGKVDRKALQSVVSRMSKGELQMCQPRALSESRKSGVKAMSPVQKNITQLFCRILPLAPDNIQDDDDFFQMGGDSILAVSVVGEARKLHRYDLTVTSIFQNPTVHQLCQHIENKPLLPSSNEQPSISPFSMLSPAEATAYKKLAVEQCDIFYDDIEDIYPCTPLQERLIVGSSHKPGAFQAQFSFVLPRNIDWSRLQSAWNIVSFTHPILRTRLIEAGQTNSSHNALQVVIRGEEVEWLQTTSDSHQPKSRWDGRMSFGTPLLYLVAIAGSRNAKLTLVMHHALFDWWSYNQILDAVQRVYVGQKVDPGPFVPFINHIQQLDKATAREFWQNEFNGLQAITFPAHRPTGYTPQAVEWTKEDFCLDLAGNGGATTSTMIRLAWGILIAQYTDSPDVVFGVTVMGRNTHTAASAAGPTIATYPFRMALQQDLDVSEALRRTQDHGVSITAFEQTGIHQIQQASSESAMACEFQSLLVVQPPSGGQTQKKPAPLLELENNDSVQQQSYANFSTHVLTIVCEPKPDILTVNAFFDATVLPSGQVQPILQQMEHILDRIVHDPQAKLGAVMRDRPNLNGEVGPLRGRGLFTEVEQKACDYLGNGFQVAADLVVPRHMRTSKLVLFVGFCGATQQEAAAIFASPEEDIRTRLSQLLTYLQESLPANIAPSVCIPVQLPNQPSELYLPDRVQLRKSASMETWTSLTSLINPREIEVRRPLSPIESKLQRILASVLHLEPDSVSIHDDFSSLGCDSIVAIQFSAQCNRENIRITARDIFDCKTVASLSIRAGERTLTTSPKSDNFSLIRSTYNNLDVFKAKAKALAKLPSASQIIDAYPCTSSHLGLMTRHHSHTIWELTGSGSPIDVTRLAESWRQVVSRHPVLRTVLSGDSSNLSPLHVVLDSYPVDVEVITGLKSDNTWSTIQRRWLANSGRNELVYKFTIYKTTAGRVFCKLEGGFAFLDATSVLILLRELGAAYHGNLPSTPAPLYRSWVVYLQQWADDHSHMDYWKQYLSGIKPCLFPMPLQDGRSHGLQVPPRSLESVTVNLAQTSALRDYCRVQGVGITSVLQLAWALVLQQYTGSADVCFGTLTSGRDAAFANINDLVGSLFNVLSCRFSLTGKTPLHEILKENQAAGREKLSHQYCSLKDVTSEVYTEGGQLFNTCLSVEEPLSNKGELEFTAIETHEETEYDLIATIVVDADITKVQLTYWSSGLDEAQATTVAGSLESSLQHIILSAENSQ